MAFDTGNMVMPVAPTGGFGGFGGGMDGDAWLILIIMFALFGNGFGGFGGYGGGLGVDFPWLMNGQTSINANTNAGFNQAATANQLTGIQASIASGFGDTALGIAGLNQAICQSGNATVAAVNNSQNAITQQMYTNQIADLERSFAAQTAATQNANALQSQLANCCCENRLATANLAADIARENCADRAAVAEGLRDVLTATQAQTQTILDKMCQMEIDNLKAQNSALQSQVLMKDFAASQTAQTASLMADNAFQTQYIVNRVAPYPIPSYTVPNPYVPATGF
jgi:hypothetical protein